MVRPPSHFLVLLLLTGLVPALGCSQKSPTEALRVTVERAPLLDSRCARVFARAPDGKEQQTEAIGLSGIRGDFNVALYRGAALPSRIVVGARGYPTEDCSGEPDAWSEESEARFDSASVTEIRVRLRHPGDGDGDGHLALSHGGTDCDDGNRDVAPGVAELCDNGKDDDCSGTADCRDTGCTAKPCQAGGICSAQGACEGATEEVDCGDGVDNDGNGLVDCEEPACDARSCQGADLCITGQTCSEGVCQGGTPKRCTTHQPCRESVGTCNPSTGLCNNSLRVGVRCDDGNPCTVGDTCNDEGVCVGPETKECTQAENGCLEERGTCDVSSGACAFAPRVGSACDDENLCSPDSSCDESGACVPTSLKTCNAPPNAACFVTAGVCNPSNAGCEYTPTPGASCSDADPCTIEDTCSDSGSCKGKPKCTSPGPCQAASCAADGTCSLEPINEGKVCPTGLCSKGSCRAPFPFTPSNFSLPAFAAFVPVVDLSCGGATARFNSTDSSFSGWCAGAQRPLVQPITQKDGTQAVLLTMRSLNVAASVRLRLTGDKPVILAVAEDATVAGIIDAGSRFTSSGAVDAGAGASASTACMGAGGGGDSVQLTAAGQMTSGGGGGGGFGTAGGPGGQGSNGARGGEAGSEQTGAPSLNLTPLRGGCAGGESVGAGALGGQGGGGIQLTVGGKLTLSGSISAAGAGGRGGAARAVGGGGGGSGGGVFLEARELAIGAQGAVAANGGGGGESHTLDRAGGAAGANGAADSTSMASGGQTSSGVVRTGAGGNGAARFVGAGAGQAGFGSTAVGGGGGGGGAGRIRLHATDNCQLNAGAVISPEPLRTGTCGN